MKCPFCSALENRVLESRINQTADITRRRRECASCQGRFTTYERVENVMPAVIKKDGRREPYVREKVLSGLTKACQKRPITSDQIDKIADQVERQLAGFSVKEVPARTVGHIVMVNLHRLDKVAYVRFASVYRDFTDVEEFVAELKDWPQNQTEQDEPTFDFVESSKN